jgi:hypothetical protein
VGSYTGATATTTDEAITTHCRFRVMAGPAR